MSDEFHEESPAIQQPSSSEELLAYALAYQGTHGWSVMALNRNKEPVTTWKRLQEHPFSTDELAREFRKTNVCGIAGICGEVSGRKAIRDFDKAEAYHRWAREHVTLARTLPTVATYRGFHVHARYTGYLGIKAFDDGEIRGNGGYAVLPPSVHPAGAIYRWINPLFEGALPEIDFAEAGLIPKDLTFKKPLVTECTEDTECTEGYRSDSLSPARKKITSVHSVHSVTLASLLSQTVPSEEGQRRKKLWNFARGLKALPEFKDLPASTLRDVIKQWHSVALPHISTKPFAETWMDFLGMWDVIKFPLGQGSLSEAISRAIALPLIPSLVEFGSPGLHVLANLCQELQRLAGAKPFFLACRTAAQALEIDHMKANRMLHLLQGEGLIEVAEPGTEHRATRWYWRGNV